MKCPPGVVLSAVQGPKPRKGGTCLRERVRVFEKFRSGTSYSADGQDLIVDESTIYIKLGVFKQRYT